MDYTVTGYVNVGRHPFDSYASGEPVAKVDHFHIKGVSADHAAEGMWTVGNRMGCDIHGKSWPSDVRSLSVGDVLRVVIPSCHDYPTGHVLWLAVAPTGWRELDAAPDTIVPLAGTNATSRTAE